MSQLFDPGDFPSPQDAWVPSKKGTTAPAPADEVVPRTGAWVLVSQRRGLLPYAHLLIGNARQAELEKLGALVGSIMTVCGEVGWTVEWPENITTMIPCPTCSGGV